MNDIVEYPSVLSELICCDILEKIDLSEPITNIPKNNEDWNRAERLLYKTLLIYLNQYKIKTIESNPELAKNLGNKLKVEEFTIQKVTGPQFVRKPSRKHVVSFILFLTKPEGGELKFKHAQITPEIGKLVFFPDDVEHIYTILANKGDYFAIANQISLVSNDLNL